jgi:hypothetical protein
MAFLFKLETADGARTAPPVCALVALARTLARTGQFRRTYRQP